MTTATNKPVPAENHRPATLKDHLQSDAFRRELAAVLPKHLTGERMARAGMTAILKTPKLAECDQRSFFQAMLTLAQWGLEPDGHHAHLIPFRNNKANRTDCQVIIDYKGMVQLLYRGGEVATVHADVVYAGDKFTYSMGQVREHTPWWLLTEDERPKERGEVMAAYARIVLKGGQEKHEVMSREEIDGIRKRSKAGNAGPWMTDWNEMAKKTVFRRACKWLPVSAEIVSAFQRDHDTPSFHAEQVHEQPRGLAGLQSKLGLDAPADDFPPEPEPAPDQSGEPDAPKPANHRPPLEELSYNEVCDLFNGAKSERDVTEIALWMIDAKAANPDHFAAAQWEHLKKLSQTARDRIAKAVDA